MRSILPILFSIIPCFSLFCPSVSGDSGKPINYHGIILGINSYENWGDLRRARKDAEALAEILRSKYSFDSLTCLYDEQANAAGIEKAFREIIPSLTNQDALLIYFSGHGYYDSLLDQGFWIPSDARVDQQGQPAVRDWVENDRIKQFLEKCEARHVLVVSDACFSGALFKGNFTELKPTTKSWYANAVIQPSRWAITSGDMEVVPDASVFGMKLLQLLKFPPREVFSVSDLAGWLKKEVSAFDGTLPVSGPLHDPNHKMGGEFVFVENGVESEFWRESPNALTANTSQNNGRIQCYSNMDSQVYVNGSWVGFVQSGSSIVLDAIENGINELAVKSEFGLFQKTIEVQPGKTSSVNAVFYDVAGSDSNKSSLMGAQGEVRLNMDQENDPRMMGLLDNNGVFVTRDGIRGNALRFQQRGNLTYRSTQLNDFGSGDFSIGLWFKSHMRENGSCVILSKKHLTIGYGINIKQGRLVGGVGVDDPEIENRKELYSRDQLTPDAWYHVVFQRSGNELSLWLNGELQKTMRHPEQWDFSNSGPLVFGVNEVHYDQYFTGVIDEVQLLKRAKSPQEIQSDYHLKFEKFRVTRKSYSERDDLDLIAKKLYGGGARVADWQEIVSRFSDDMPELWDYLGLDPEERIWVTYLNRRFFNSARHFYAFRTTRMGDIDDEIHQEAKINGNDFVLSSWINMELPMLIEF